MTKTLIISSDPFNNGTILNLFFTSAAYIQHITSTKKRQLQFTRFRIEIKDILDIFTLT